MASLQPIAPPHSVDAEKALLGAILRDPEQFNIALDLVKPEYFFLDSHGKIYEALVDLDQKGEPTDFITLAEKLRGLGDKSQMLKPAYLVELTENCPISENIEHYAVIVRDQYFLRRLARVCQDTITKASSHNTTVLEVIENLEREFKDITNTQDRGGLVLAKDILNATLGEIEERLKSESTVTGIPSGFIDLDNVTSGWQKSDLMILAARPGMGKTAFALNLALNAAKAGHAIAFFSLEMSQNQLMTRLLAGEARVDSSRLRKGELSEEEQDRLLFAARTIAKLPGMFSVDETPGITLPELRSRCRRFQRDHGLGLVIIDYLQLMGVTKARDSREREISEISGGLKALSKELGVGVMALAQLNRGPDARPDKRPKISDLRESGSIEQDADQVIFLYRDEYYNKNSEDAGRVEVILAKNRHGQLTTVKLAYLANFLMFHNLQAGS